MEKKEIKKQGYMQSVQGNPLTAHEMVNNYGTYNIQPTADTENEYPAIAQGISEKTAKERIRDEKH